MVQYVIKNNTIKEMTKIFYDGTNLVAHEKSVEGFTTNTTIMKSGNETCYQSFYQKHAHLINDRPISFQVFSDDGEEVLTQARQIASIGRNVYAKIPVINSHGISMLPFIVDLLKEGVPINITAIFTTEQMELISNVLHESSHSTPTIVSVFAGRISDTGQNPQTYVATAVRLFSDRHEVQVLWAGVKDNLVFQQARDIGCHIVTCPDSIMTRLSRLNQPLDNVSQDSVSVFLKDAKDSGMRILK